MVSSIAQMMDTEPHHTPTPSRSDDVVYVQSLVAQEETAVVVHSTIGVEVINCSDNKSCYLKRHLFRDSSDDDNDNDDGGVDQGVLLPTTCEFKLVIADSVINPHFAPSTSTVPSPSSILVVDKFYNVVGKALHLDAIIPKKELDWWVNH